MLLKIPIISTNIGYKEMVGVGSESGSLTYDDAPRPSVRLHALGLHPFAVRRLSYHLIGSLVALHAGLVQSRRAASAPRTLKFLVVLRLSEGIPQNTLVSDMEIRNIKS